MRFALDSHTQMRGETSKRMHSFDFFFFFCVFSFKIEVDQHELNTKKSTERAMSVLKDWLEDLISCVLKNVLFNIFSLLKNYEK